MIRNKISHLALLLSFFTLPFAEEYSGVVVDGSNVMKPIPNVLVSAGYSGITTHTDAQGKFTLTFDPTSSTLPFRVHNQMKVTWNQKSRVFDFRNALPVTKIAIFNLNGRSFYSSTIPAKERVIKLPRMSRGIYVVSLHTKNGVIFTSKFSSVSPSIFSIKAPVFNQRSGAAYTPVTLVFRNDNYYPADLVLNEPSKNIVVGMNSDQRAYLFDQSKVHTYNFTMTVNDSMTMERDARLEEYVPATFTFDDSLFGEVGLRYKGSTYSLPNCFSETGERYNKPECKKISFKVKFNEYVDSARFYAMKSLYLHSMSADGSKMHDMLGYGLFRDMGIFSPRTSYAKVYINGVFQGLFVTVEPIDGRFTKSRWPAYGDGNLYKEAWPTSSSNITYREKLETNVIPGQLANVSRMVNLYKTIDSSTTETFVQKVGRLIDINYFIRYFAVDRAINNWDGITAWYTENGWKGNHNFFMYEEENSGGKIWLIPWDLDNTFWRNDPFIGDADVPNWNETPSSCDPIGVFGGSSHVTPSNCDKLTRLLATTQWNTFVKAGEELLNNYFTSDSMNNKIDRYTALIDTIIYRDPKIEYESWLYQVEMLKKDIAAIRTKFGNYIHGITTQIDTSDYSSPFTGTGFLHLNEVNNFEFTPAESLSFVYPYSSAGTTIKVVHDTIGPIWGKADLNCIFSYYPVEDDSKYSEYSGFVVPFSETSDITDVKDININFKSDSQRYLWVYIYSDVYARHNVKQEYGWFITVNDKNKIYTLSMDICNYPSWADTNNPDLRDSVLTSAVGIGFNPNAHFDTFGELTVVPDSGFLRVDNIDLVY